MELDEGFLLGMGPLVVGEILNLSGGSSLFQGACFALLYNLE